MNFDSRVRLISEILRSRKKFVIPIYQREYSWEKREIKAFYDDIVSNIFFDNEVYKDKDYFIGNMLLIGDFNDPKQNSLYVVDGQQRLITITIFLAAIRDFLYDFGQIELGKIVNGYIIGIDDDGKDFKIIEHEYMIEYFESVIQLGNKSFDYDFITEEEERMIYCYELVKSELKNIIKSKKDSLGIIKAIRTQLLNSVVIVNITKDEEFGSKLFEILNAKGRDLTTVDLIKNVIFDKLSGDKNAISTWNSIKKMITQESKVNFSVFYRHFWNANYSKATEMELYTNFSKIDAINYTEFLKDMEIFAYSYSVVLNSNNNFDETRYLHYLHKKFNIIQPRMLTAQLHSSLSRGVITRDMYNKAVKAICLFSYCYSSWGSLRPSRLENDYSKFSIDLKKSTSINETRDILNSLANFFESEMPQITVLKDNFSRLNKVNINNRFNIKSKFFLEEKYNINESIFERTYQYDNNDNSASMIELLYGLFHDSDIHMIEGFKDTEITEFYNYVKYSINSMRD